MTQQLKHLDPQESHDGPPGPDKLAPSDLDRKHSRIDKTPLVGSGGRIPRIPTDVTTPHSKLVYLCLSTVRSTTVASLSEATRIPQIRLYPVLDALVDRGHVDSDGSTFSLSHVE